LNPPPPAPQQPFDWDERNPETKLFAKFAATGEETGWVGMVGATKSASFPANGELMELFFEGYDDPHWSVEGRNMGDAWRSMLERWLDIVFDAEGGFSFEHIFNAYNIDRGRWYDSYCANFGMQHTMGYNLFGDPSLRIGGIEGLSDTAPPTTSDDTDGAWHSESVEVTLTAVDAGSPPSGVRTTKYRIDGGGWLTGVHFAIEAPSNHSNDGVHAIEYYSVDFLGNTEVTKSTEVRIDTVVPDTDALLDGEPAARVSQAGAVPPSIGSATQVVTAGSQGILFYPSGSTPPSRGCYNSPVEVTLTATDDRSGVASTWYDLDGRYPLGFGYTEPFDVSGGDYVDWRTLHYWSEDNAGNVEPRESVRFCVSNEQAGMTRDKIRILAALEEIVMIQMWEELASALPPIEHVRFERSYGLEWVWIGTDWDEGDGWSVPWTTTAVDDGNYLVRMIAYPPYYPPQNTKGVQQDPIHEEVVMVKVCNVPDSAYEFDLDASSGAVDRGERVRLIGERAWSTRSASSTRK
jgi:hypothetical protein